MTAIRTTFLALCVGFIFILGGAVAEVLTQGYAALDSPRVIAAGWAIAHQLASKTLWPALGLAVVSTLTGYVLARVAPAGDSSDDRRQPPWRRIGHSWSVLAYVAVPAIVILSQYLDRGASWFRVLFAAAIAMLAYGLAVLLARLSRRRLSGSGKLRSRAAGNATHASLTLLLVGLALQGDWHLRTYGNLSTSENLQVVAALIGCCAVSFALLLRYGPEDPVEARQSSVIALSPLLALVGLAAAVILVPVFPRVADRRSPNVLLISIDTLRSDHLGCYGYHRDTSPEIDTFSLSATRYEHAYSAAPWTVPTHASLFTGKSPFEHGAHTFAVHERINNVNSLHRSHLTLAEIFRATGYRTGAFVSNSAYLGRRWNLDQGFDTWEVHRVYADRLNQRVFSWLESGRDRPFLLFVNFIDTHTPYNTAPREGWLDEPVSQDAELVSRLYEEVMPMKGLFPVDLAEQVIAQYDTAIANVDEQVGALLDRLEALGLATETLVVITSDHGEYFGEHFLVEHSKDVYEEALRVPLLVRDPGQVIGRIDDTHVVSDDLAHMVLAKLPMLFEQRHLQLFPNAPGNHPVLAENYFTRTKDLFHEKWGWRFQRIRTAIVDWPYKYIHSSDGQHELYQLIEDPAESRNLIDVEPEIAADIERTWRDYRERRGEPRSLPDQRRLGEEDLERLRALGYVD